MKSTVICPFCGHDEIAVCTVKRADKPGFDAAAGCAKCGASCPGWIWHETTDGARAAAVAAWEKRHKGVIVAESRFDIRPYLGESKTITGGGQIWPKPPLRRPRDLRISDMIGKTLQGFDVSDEKDEILLFFTDGHVGRFYHQQGCCETVIITEIAGDFSDLIGHPLLVADERVQESARPEGYDSGDPDTWADFESRTWTFYTFRSLGGTVDVRWCGESNGFYSETVDFEMLLDWEVDAMRMEGRLW